MSEDAYITVPDPGADWIEFALSYNGYMRHHDFDTVAAIGNGTLDRWQERGELPVDLNTLRCALFFEQRRWRHFDVTPEGSARQYIAALIERIRDLSGGVLPGPPDPYP